MQITNPVFNAIRYNAPGPKDLKSNVPKPQFGSVQGFLPKHVPGNLPKTFNEFVRLSKGEPLCMPPIPKKLKSFITKYCNYIKNPDYDKQLIDEIIYSPNFRANGVEGFNMEHVVNLSSQLGKQSERKYVKSILNEKNIDGNGFRNVGLNAQRLSEAHELDPVRTEFLRKQKNEDFTDFRFTGEEIYEIIKNCKTEKKIAKDSVGVDFSWAKHEIKGFDVFFNIITNAIDKNGKFLSAREICDYLELFKVKPKVMLKTAENFAQRMSFPEDLTDLEKMIVKNMRERMTIKDGVSVREYTEEQIYNHIISLRSQGIGQGTFKG